MAAPPAIAEHMTSTGHTSREAAFWFIAASAAFISALHYLTDVHLIPYHSIYRSLYYIPIAVAAVRYGRLGGTLTALLIVAAYIPHVVLSWGLMPTDGLNDLLETGLFVFVGIFAGTLSDAERVQRRRAQEAATELAIANAQLQEQAEQAERTRAQIASILESLGSGIITLDPEGQLVTANSAAQALLPDLGAGHGRLPALLQSSVETGGRSFQQVSAGMRTLGLHTAPLRGARAETVGTVLVLEDLTERKALEEQIQRAQRQAALGRLAGGLAHEIRNPIGIVRAAAQMLHRELRDDGRHVEYTQVIQSEVDRVDRLIEELISYARPRQLARGPVDLPDLARRAIALVRAYAEQQGVAGTVNVLNEVPLLEGDAELLHQALVNLLMNAVQATPSGGLVTIDVTSTIDARAPAILVTVRDTGRGIAPENLQHVFDPFFTTRHGGVGLGLSIVQQIVQEHGGTIDVRSEPGAGTAFVIRLPSPDSHCPEPTTGKLSG